MEIKIKRLDKNVEMPRYAKQDDVGFDLRSSVELVVEPGQKVLVPTGLAMELPKGYVGNIRARSGLAAKNSIDTMGGIIDPGYRGEIQVILINHGKEQLTIEKNMIIAQMLVHQVIQASFVESEELSETERGDGAFGHSGLN